MTQRLLYATSIPVCEGLDLQIPTVGQIYDDEENYFSTLTMILSNPYDLMVQLDDAGIDFTTVTDFDLFVMMFQGLQERDTSLFFGDMDLKGFAPMIDPKGESIVLRHNETGLILDRRAHALLCHTLRKIHFYDNNRKKPGNEEARKYMIERARIKQKRAARTGTQSQLEDLIISMVNTEQFHYDFETTRGLSIYQFNASVKQVVKKVNYDHVMVGCYAGTVDMKKMNKQDLNWLSTK